MSSYIHIHTYMHTTPSKGIKLYGVEAQQRSQHRTTAAPARLFYMRRCFICAVVCESIDFNHSGLSIKTSFEIICSRVYLNTTVFTRHITLRHLWWKLFSLQRRYSAYNSKGKHFRRHQNAVTALTIFKSTSFSSEQFRITTGVRKFRYYWYIAIFVSNNIMEKDLQYCSCPDIHTWTAVFWFKVLFWFDWVNFHAKTCKVCHDGAHFLKTKQNLCIIRIFRKEEEKFVIICSKQWPEWMASIFVLNLHHSAIAKSS